MLTRRLESLVDSGMLERHLYSEKPARYEYRLTPRGMDFRPVLLAMMAWGNKHLAPEGKSIELVDEQSGRSVEPVLVDGGTGVPITYERHVVRAGPMATERLRQRLAAARAAQISSH
jgi:hypothetical protein